GSPIIGPEPSQDRDEPLPLPAEHLEQVAWVEVARALGPQKQLAGQELFWYWAAMTHRSPSVPGDGRPAVPAPFRARCVVLARVSWSCPKGGIGSSRHRVPGEEHVQRRIGEARGHSGVEVGPPLGCPLPGD